VRKMWWKIWNWIIQRTSRAIQSFLLVAMSNMQRIFFKYAKFNCARRAWTQ
jgi:hypothetical protein